MVRFLSLSLIFIASVAVSVVAGGCGSKNSTGGGDGGLVTCADGVDLDGDGYGQGCEAGTDCNDFDPSINVDCCGAGAYQGCPCDPAVDNAPVTCFEGPPEVAGTAPCKKGMRSCDAATNSWGPCYDQVLPEPESCDLADNDCDGEIDEGALNTCGNCVPGCDQSGIDTDPFPIPPVDPNVDIDGVGLDPNGDLVLDSSTIENHFLWIANDAEGTVSKIDTRTGKEVARYASVSHQVLINHAGGATISNWNTDANGNSYADNRPSRTAIDYRADVWIANRAHDGAVANRQPSLTKILNVPQDCIDRNGNLIIDTSSDVNMDGIISLTDPLEFFGEADECIAMTVVVGANLGTARAIAIDQGIDPGDPGNPWVGMWGEKVFYQINGRTGALMQRVPATGTLDIQPYGAAIDSVGRLWAPNNCCGGASAPTIVAINTAANPAPVVMTKVGPAFTGADAGYGSYGLVVDTMDRVWVGGWPKGGLLRYNPADDTWIEAQVTGLFGGGWGVRGVALDTHGNIWAAMHLASSGGKVARINANTGVATGSWDIGGTRPVGVGVDFDGDVWTVNQNTSNASRLHVDQGTLEPAAHPITSNTVDVFPVGRLPYTYSDFTGLGLRTVTRPSGDYTVPIQGCASGEAAKWLGITWSATTPPNTSVEIWVRAGDDLATLGQQPLFGPWLTSPADFSLPPGPVPDAKFLLLTIRLISADRETTPVVHSYSVQWACAGEPVD